MQNIVWNQMEKCVIISNVMLESGKDKTCHR